MFPLCLFPHPLARERWPFLRLFCLYMLAFPGNQSGLHNAKRKPQVLSSLVSLPSFLHLSKCYACFMCDFEFLCILPGETGKSMSSTPSWKQNLHFKVFVRLLHKLILSGRNLNNDWIIDIFGFFPCIRFLHLFLHFGSQAHLEREILLYFFLCLSMIAQLFLVILLFLSPDPRAQF